MRRAGVQRADWERGNLQKVVKNAHERKAHVEQLERAVLRLEEWVVGGRKVKEEEKKEVEEVQEQKVKEEAEAQVLEEKEEVSGMAWLRSFLGNRVAGATMEMP